MFLLFLLGHRLLEPISMKLKEGMPIDSVIPIFQVIDQIIGGESSLKDIIQKFTTSQEANYMTLQMKYIFQNVTQLSFEDVIRNLESDTTGVYNHLCHFSGNASLHATGIFKEMHQAELLDMLEMFSDFLKAANLDADKIKLAMNNIFQNTSITILDALDQLGFDFRPLFNIYDKILDVFKPGSNYPLTQFLKEYIIQPPSLVEEITNNARIIFVDWKISYQVIENLILCFVKLLSSFLQSAFSFFKNALEIAFKQVSFIVDFRIKSLNDRLNNSIEGLKKMYPDDPYTENNIQILEEFIKKGYNFGEIIKDDDVKLIYSLIENFSRPNNPMIKVLAQAFDFLPFGVYVNFALDVANVLKNNNGKMLDIQNSIIKIKEEEDLNSFKTAMMFFYDLLVDQTPKMITNGEIVAWLGNIIGTSEANDIVATFLSLPELIDAAQEIKISDILQDADKYIEKVAVWTSSSDIVEVAADLLELLSLGSNANCNIAAKTVQKALGKVLQTVSKFGSISSFPFNIIFEPLSRFIDKYAKLFSQEKISLKELLSSVYQPLGILVDVVHEVTSKITADQRVVKILDLIPTTFLNAQATLKKFNDLNAIADISNVTLPMLVDCFVIGDKMKAGETFHDVVPLKWLADAAETISSTPADQLTTASVCNAYAIDPNFVIREISWFENQFVGEQTSLANVIKKYTNYDFTNSLTALSNLAHKVPIEVITVAECENAMNTFFEDFERVPINAEPTKMGLSAGAIVGIVIACVAIVAVIVIVIVITVKKKKNDTDPPAEP